MKKVFLVLLVSFIGVCAFAQDETVIEVQGQKGPYVTNGFWDNWFISAGDSARVSITEAIAVVLPVPAYPFTMKMSSSSELTKSESFLRRLS